MVSHTMPSFGCTAFLGCSLNWFVNHDFFFFSGNKGLKMMRIL